MGKEDSKGTLQGGSHRDGEDLYLRFLATRGLERRGLASREEYLLRLEHELGVITKLGFSSYFVIVSDIVNWALSQGIVVGPGRGSAAGSLVSYCLFITHLDPIRYGLYFERFLNPERVSWPDIDLDFEDERRHEIITYLQERFGYNHVAHIGTFGSAKAKGAIRDVARVLGHPYQVGDRLANMIPPPVSGQPCPLSEAISQNKELRRLLESESSEGEVLRLAAKFEDSLRSFGTHASGVVISDKPVWEYIPLYKGTDGKPTTQWPMEEVEEAGLIKFDILGIKALSTIRKCIELIERRRGIKVDPLQIPVDDSGVYEQLSKGDTEGVFQLEGSSGIRDLTRKIQPRCLEDLSLLVALYRPGPLGTGLVDQVVKVRQGRQKPSYLFPELEPILEETAGAIVYQEQIMKISTELAGFTGAEADTLRKAVGKKNQALLMAQKEKLVKGLREHSGIPERLGQELFAQIEGFAKYCFNRCLDGETLVQTSEGDKRVEDLKPGDRLYSLDPNTGEIRETECVELIDTGVQETYTVLLAGGEVRVCCTADHAFLCRDGKKHKLSEMLEESLAFKLSEEILYIESLYYSGARQTYNVHVSDPAHNFLLSNGLVSGNSHSCAYSYIGYQMAWLKHHYPAEFICSCLISDSNEPDKVTRYITYCKKTSVEILPPDINESEPDFSVVSDRKIRFGLAAVKNIGKSAARMFIREREKNGPYRSLADFVRRLNRRYANKTKVESLIQAGAFDSLDQNRARLLLMVGALWDYTKKEESWRKKLKTYETRLERWKKREEEREKGLTRRPSLVKPTMPEKPQEPKAARVSPLPILRKLAMEKELLGYYVSGHPVDLVADRARMGSTPVSELHNMGRTRQGIVAVPILLKEVSTKRGQRMGYVTLEDQTGSVQAVVLPHIWEKYKTVLSGGTPIKVKLSLSGDGSAKVEAVTRVAIASSSAEKPVKIDVLGVESLEEGLSTIPPGQLTEVHIFLGSGGKIKVIGRKVQG